MQSNAETKAALSREIQQLNEIIIDVVRNIDDRATRLQLGPEERLKILEDLQESSGWRERIEQLRK